MWFLNLIGSKISSTSHHSTPRQFEYGIFFEYITILAHSYKHAATSTQLQALSM